jgi:hypothetical protein
MVLKKRVTNKDSRIRRMFAIHHISMRLLVSNHRNNKIKCAKPYFEEVFCVGVKFSILLYEKQKLQVFKEQSAQKNMSI